MRNVELADSNLRAAKQTVVAARAAAIRLVFRTKGSVAGHHPTGTLSPQARGSAMAWASGSLGGW